MNKEIKQIVVDIDGTLCEDTNGENYDNPKPLKNVIEAVNIYWTRGVKVIIHTARGMNRFEGNLGLIEAAYREKTEAWLKNNRVMYDELKFGKPSADLYIDDKSILPNTFANGRISKESDEEYYRY